MKTRFQAFAVKWVNLYRYSLAGSEKLRVAAGAGPGTLEAPDKLDATWNPQPWGAWKKT
jgi:hypothetical protein